MSQLFEQLRKQTKEMAISAILLTRKLPQNDEGWTIKKQLIRSATSVATNYRSACRGRSDQEFYSKSCIVVEELDESMFWLELTEDIELIRQNDVQPVMDKMNKLLKILSAAKSTLRNKINPKELD